MKTGLPYIVFILFYYNFNTGH